MANEKENHALVADDEVPTKFALMANSSSSSENKFPPPVQIYSPPKKDLSWTGLLEFVDGTATDFSRPTPSIDASKCNKSELQSSKFSISEHGESESSGSIMSKPVIKFVKEADYPRVIKSNKTKNARKSPVKYAEMYRNISKGLPEFVDDTVTGYRRPTPSSIMSKPIIKFVKEADCPRVIKINNTENARKSTVKYAEMYRNISKGPKVDNGETWLKDNYTHKNMTPRAVLLKPGTTPIVTFFLRTKDETSSILKNLITEIENLKDLKVKIIRSDNGREFKNQDMNEFCTKKGIRREFSNARTPQQNGVAERKNRTVIEAAITMLADAKLPVTFWAEAVNTTYYVQTKVLVNKSQNKTPYELFNSRIPAIGFLRPFGYHVMILNTLDHLGKFDAKWDKGYFVGYSLSSKAFRVFKKRTKKVEEICMFKYTFGDTTNAVTLNEVEDDLSNIETSIPVSPTPTFRIHKDHPKSQIIGPVDTPVQTRHKSKEMKKQSFIATIHQKTNPDFYSFVYSYVSYPKKNPRRSLMLSKTQFQMSVMGELTFFLGLQVLQKKDGIFLSQDKYVGDILKKFGYSDVRPDIMFAVCAYARHQVTPKECNLHAVNSIFRYLKDSDYGGATQDRKSTTGGCQFLERMLISWQCKKQTIMSTSTTKAEYVAAASGCGQVL
nr:retrovirus-related Pol polyprotein from transposon TNT 1-94 [Tanacetum cinerariifolium]